MSAQPDQYKLEDVIVILQYSRQTVQRLVQEGILIKRSRGQSARYSRASVEALLRHLEAGGGLWDAPKMRVTKPAAVAPVVTAQPGKTKTANGGRRSASTSERDPSKFALNRNKTLKQS